MIAGPSCFSDIWSTQQDSNLRPYVSSQSCLIQATSGGTSYCVLQKYYQLYKKNLVDLGVEDEYNIWPRT